MKNYLLIHTADIHIGAFTNRVLRNANIDALEKIAGYAIENNIPYMIIAGDFFENPRVESYEVLSRVFRIMKMLRENNVKVISIPGSHDTSVRGTSILHLLRDAGFIYLPRFEIIGDTLKLYPLVMDNYVFYGLPGLRNNRELEYLGNRRVFFKDLERFNDKYNIVFIAHTSVKIGGYDPSTYSYRYGKIVIGEDNILRNIPANTRYVALGHIHFPTPLFDEAEANIVYPGSPIGRDANDLYETYLLRRKYDRDRRFLLVDLDREKPYVKSIWDNFGIYVEYYRSYYSGLDDLINDVKRLLKDLNGKYNVLILSIENIKASEIDKVVKEIRRIEQSRENLVIHLRRQSSSIVDTESLALEIGSLDNLEDIEREAVAEALKRLGIKISPEKILELINILSEKRPEDAHKDEFYDSLFKRVKPLLEEIINES